MDGGMHTDAAHAETSKATVAIEDIKFASDGDAWHALIYEVDADRAAMVVPLMRCQTTTLGEAFAVAVPTSAWGRRLKDRLIASETVCHSTKSNSAKLECLR